MSTLMTTGGSAFATDLDPGRLQVATFVIDGLYLGIEVLQVQEVLRPQPLTHVPLAPPAIKGLLNLRGQIVTAIDLRCRFGIDGPRAGEVMNLVVRTTDGVVSFLVDGIGEVVDVSEAELLPTPEGLSPATRGLVRGVYALEDRLLLLLDLERAALVDDLDRVDDASSSR